MRTALVASTLLLPLASATRGIAHFGDYPGYLPGQQYSHGGTLLVEDVEGAHMITMSGYITGLAPSTSGGWHIHVGFTCSTEDPAGDIGGHYFPSMETDPWNKVPCTPPAAITLPSRDCAEGVLCTRLCVYVLLAVAACRLQLLLRAC